MKLDALDHPKTHDLVSRLHISRPTAIGHLELLWAFTGKNSPQGDLGKWPDGAIASACEWTGDPATFIEALVAARFLDRDATHRLRVHDWHEHAPGWVRAKLKGMRREFVVPSMTKPRGSPRGSPPRSAPTGAPSILGKGREAKGSEAKGVVVKLADPGGEPGHEPTDGAGSDATTELGEPSAHDLTTLIQNAYPAGTFGGQNWILTERAIGDLLDGGDHAAELLDAAKAYARQQAAMGNTGTQFIRSPAKFYTEGHWRGPFPLPAARPGARKTVADRIAALGVTDDDATTTAAGAA